MSVYSTLYKWRFHSVVTSVHKPTHLLTDLPVEGKGKGKCNLQLALLLRELSAIWDHTVLPATQQG